MSDNPFSEPDDSERTVVRPVPGGRQPPPAGPEMAPPRAETAEAPARAAPLGEAGEIVAMEVNPLVGAAAPL